MPDPNHITSRDNRWLKAFRAALGGAGPKHDEPIGVESAKLIEEAIHAGLQTEAVLVSTAGERALPGILIAASDSIHGISQSRILRTSDKLFESVSGTEAPQGIAALFRQPVWGLEDALRGSTRSSGSLPLVIVLVALQDPGNVGTIMRSAEAFGATGLVTTRGTADPWSPKAIRASAGSALRLPVLRGMDAPVLLAQLKINQVKVLAATSRARERSEAAAPGWPSLQGPAAIFIGNEGSGLPPEIERAADEEISLPMSAAVESLNAGVAASLLLYEAARQRWPNPV